MMILEPAPRKAGKGPPLPKLRGDARHQAAADQLTHITVARGARKPLGFIDGVRAPSGVLLGEQTQHRLARCQAAQCTPIFCFISDTHCSRGR